MEPSSPGANAPVQTASRPVTPTSVRMTSTIAEALETPIKRSLSVREAKARIQKFERKKSFVRTATGRIYRSCQPRRVELSRPEDSTRLRSTFVLTPMVIVATVTKRKTMTAWILSVINEILKPPKAMMISKEHKLAIMTYRYISSLRQLAQ